MDFLIIASVLEQEFRVVERGVLGVLGKRSSYFLHLPENWLAPPAEIQQLRMQGPLFLLETLVRRAPSPSLRASSTGKPAHQLEEWSG